MDAQSGDVEINSGDVTDFGEHGLGRIEHLRLLVRLPSMPSLVLRGGLELDAHVSFRRHFVADWPLRLTQRERD